MFDRDALAPMRTGSNAGSIRGSQSSQGGWGVTHFQDFHLTTCSSTRNLKHSLTPTSLTSCSVLHACFPLLLRTVPPTRSSARILHSDYCVHFNLSSRLLSPFAFISLPPLLLLILLTNSVYRSRSVFMYPRNPMQRDRLQH